MTPAHKLPLALLLLLFFCRSSSAQTGLGGIGPTGAQVAGAAVGVAAVTVVVLYVTLHKPSITGCVQSANGTNSLTDNKNNLKYTLVNQRRDQAGRTSQAVGKEEKGQRWPSQLSREEGKTGLWPLPARKILCRCMSAQNSAAYLNGQRRRCSGQTLFRDTTDSVRKKMTAKDTPLTLPRLHLLLPPPPSDLPPLHRDN